MEKSNRANRFSTEVRDRRPVHKGGFIHHSDRGGQYLSIRYTERLALAGMEPSVGSLGDSYEFKPVRASGLNVPGDHSRAQKIRQRIRGEITWFCKVDYCILGHVAYPFLNENCGVLTTP